MFGLGLYIWDDIAMGSFSGFDHVVTSINSLPAPSGGYIDLTSGSWAFAAPINIGANVLRVAAGVSAYLQGMGPTKVVTAAGAGLVVEGSANINGLSITSGTCAVSVAGTGQLNALSDIIESGGIGVQVSDTAEARFGLCAINSDGIGIDAIGGKVYAVESRVTTRVTQECAIRLNNSSAQVFLTECVLNSTCNATPNVLVSAGSLLRMCGGTLHTMSASKGPGIAIAGDLVVLQILGGNFYSLSYQVLYTSGIVTSACIADTYNSSSSGGINWPAANIPTTGLILSGNTWNTAAPFVGFSAISARVNVKACCTSAGLKTETPIVP